MIRGLADTSVFIARESGLPLDEAALPDELAISVITVGELRVGVLAATDVRTRDRRLSTLTVALTLDPLPVDDAVAEAWARLRLLLRDGGQRMPVNDAGGPWPSRVVQSGASSERGPVARTAGAAMAKMTTPSRRAVSTRSRHSSARSGMRILRGANAEPQLKSSSISTTAIRTNTPKRSAVNPMRKTNRFTPPVRTPQIVPTPPPARKPR